MDEYGIFKDFEDIPILVVFLAFHMYFPIFYLFQHDAKFTKSKLHVMVTTSTTKACFQSPPEAVDGHGMLNAHQKIQEPLENFNQK